MKTLASLTLSALALYVLFVSVGIWWLLGGLIVMVLGAMAREG